MKHGLFTVFFFIVLMLFTNEDLYGSSQYEESNEEFDRYLQNKYQYKSPLLKDPGYDNHLKDRFNSKEQSLFITTDKIIEGHIYPRGDHDFYQINLPTAGILRIRHSGLVSPLASAIKLHNERGTEMRWHHGNMGESQIITHPLKQGGVYYIEVADTKDRNYSEKPYLLEVNFLEAIDNAEPNDSMDRATPVKLPITFTGKIFPPSDIDRFRFYLPGKGCLRIILTGIDPKAGTQIKLSDHNGKKVTGEGSTLFSPRAGGWVKSPDQGYQKLTLNVNNRGTYILSLKQLTGIISSSDYRLRIEFYNGALDKHEPNDSIERAKRIYPGEKIEGYILPARDHDYYKVKLKGFGRLYVGINTLKGEIRPSINVLGINKVTSLTGGWVDGELKEPHWIRRARKTHQDGGVIKGRNQISDSIPESDSTSDRDTHFVEVKIDAPGIYTIIAGAADSEKASLEAYKLHCIFINKSKGLPGYPRIEGY
jgi:hypothetical protein